MAPAIHQQDLPGGSASAAKARGLEDLFEAQAETGDAPAHRLLIVLAVGNCVDQQ